MPQSIDLSLPDGSKTKITLFQENITSKGPLLVLFPAMGVKASYYKHFGQHMADQGIPTITADLRGLGHSSIRPSRKSNFGYEEMIQLDYLTIFKTIDQKFPNHDLYVLGHSLGGQLACLFLSRYNFNVKGLILLASCSVHTSGWEGWHKVQTTMAIHLFGLVNTIVGYFPGDKLGFGGKAPQQQMIDWCRQGKTGRYLPGGSNHDYEKSMANLTIPVLAIPIEGDSFSPAKAMKNLCDKLNPNSDIETITYTKEAAGHKSLNHFNWAKNPKGIGGLIIRWVKGGE